METKIAIFKEEREYGVLTAEISKATLAWRKGGKIAGDARKKLEIESGKKVSSKENYLQQPQNKKISLLKN